MNVEGRTMDRKRIVVGILLLLILTLAQAACVQFCCGGR
jgi:hypothetical protein